MKKYTLEEIMKFKNFLVVGDTKNETKKAFEICDNLQKHSYNVMECSKYDSLNDFSEIGVINLCINPSIGITLLKDLKKTVKVVLIQPGASSDEIIEFLESKNIPYLNSCSLIGLKINN